MTAVDDEAKRAKAAQYRKAWKERNPQAVKDGKKAYLARHPEKRAAERTRWKKTLTGKRMVGHTFTGIDGEGWTDDVEHNYYMIATSDSDTSLYTGNALTSQQSLNFISRLPVTKKNYIVSFFFDYDATMILRDFAREDPDKCATLFHAGLDKYVWWKGFGLKYRPHRSLSVKRWTEDNSAKEVVIHDVQGFFQSSFVVALKKLGVGTPAQIRHIEKMKGERDSFTPEEAPAILKYSQSECRLLVSLMEKIRDMSHVAKINAEPYEGPGAMARRTLETRYGKPTHELTMSRLPQALVDAAPLAMYGGRFETLAVGAIPRAVVEFDVHSAYPYAMANLPCLVHGKWVRSLRRQGVYQLSHITFRDQRPPVPGLAYPLPVRRSSGELFYPQTGSGWYWKHEYDRPTLDVTVDINFCWVPAGCDCRPFAWVHDMYHQREELELSAKGSGICLKLTLNTLYGKMAQQKPVAGKFLNYIYASLITSNLRTRMYDYYLQLPRRSVVMFATDAIFTTSDTLATTDTLGGLERANQYDSLVLVQPGLYFNDTTAHFKTRGIPKKYVSEHAAEIRAAAIAGTDYTFPITQFRGLRLSLATHNLTDMGNWITTERVMRTRTTSKRVGERKLAGITWTSPAENHQGESFSKSNTAAVSLHRQILDMESDGDEDQDYTADIADFIQ